MPTGKTNIDGFLKRAGLALNALVLLVGLPLGVFALWDAVKPASDLIGEVVVVEAELPSDLVDDIDKLPSTVANQLLADEDLLALLPDEQTRNAVVQSIAEVVKRSSEFFDFQLPFHSFIRIVIRNDSDQTLEAVSLGFRHAMQQPITIVYPNGDSTTVEGQRLLELGDLVPNSEIVLSSWGLALFTSSDDALTLAHKGGVGDLHLQAPVPQLFWGNEGIWFSYKHTSLALLSILLLFVGVLGLRRYRQSRMAG